MNVKIIAIPEDQLLEFLGRTQTENLSDSDFIQRLIDSSENQPLEPLKEAAKEVKKHQKLAAAPKEAKHTMSKKKQAPQVSGKPYEAPRACFATDYSVATPKTSKLDGRPVQIEREAQENEFMLQRLIEYVHALKNISKSNKRKVACVITDQDGNIVSAGVNESVLPDAERLEGFDHNQPGRYKTFEHVLHAEEIALSSLPLDPQQEYNMFLTSPPCLHCAAQILHAARVRNSKINVYVVDPVSKNDMIKFAAPEWYQDGITPEQIMLDQRINDNLVDISFLEDNED